MILCAYCCAREANHYSPENGIVDTCCDCNECEAQECQYKNESLIDSAFDPYEEFGICENE